MQAANGEFSEAALREYYDNRPSYYDWVYEIEEGDDLGDEYWEWKGRDCHHWRKKAANAEAHKQRMSALRRKWRGVVRATGVLIILHRRAMERIYVVGGTGYQEAASSFEACARGATLPTEAAVTSEVACATTIASAVPMVLADIPDELLRLILSTIYKSAALDASTLPCAVDSGQSLRQLRRARHVTRGVVLLGGVCRRLRALHLESGAREVWVGCARAVWIERTFGLLTEVGDRSLWFDAEAVAQDEDFEWTEGGAWRHFSERSSATDGSPDLIDSARTLLLEQEALMRSAAVSGRQSARFGNIAGQEPAAALVQMRVRQTLRGMLELSLPRTHPALWVEVQLWAALWLSVVLCVRELLEAVRSDSALREMRTSEPIGQLHAFWEEVHNGVTGPWYWKRTRAPTAEVLHVHDCVRVKRIWRRAEQHAAECQAAGPVLIYLG